MVDIKDLTVGRGYCGWSFWTCQAVMLDGWFGILNRTWFGTKHAELSNSDCSFTLSRPRSIGRFWYLRRWHLWWRCMREKFVWPGRFKRMMIWEWLFGLCHFVLSLCFRAGLVPHCFLETHLTSPLFAIRFFCVRNSSNRMATFFLRILQLKYGCVWQWAQRISRNCS